MKYFNFFLALLLTINTSFAQDMDLPYNKDRTSIKQDALNLIKRKKTPQTPPKESTPPEEPPAETPPEFYGEPIPTENQTIFFVIDSSCSMGWDRRSYIDQEGNRRVGNRMDRAKAELIRSISSLSKNFKYNALAYGCSIRSFRPNLIKATTANKQAGINWTSSLSANGGTMTGPATAHSLRNAPDNKSVVLLTDGAPNCGASGMSGHRSVIRSANRQGAVITVFGIGASGSFRDFCQSIARENGGAYRDVP